MPAARARDRGAGSRRPPRSTGWICRPNVVRPSRRSSTNGCGRRRCRPTTPRGRPERRPLRPPARAGRRDAWKELRGVRRIRSVDRRPDGGGASPTSARPSPPPTSRRPARLSVEARPARAESGPGHDVHARALDAVRRTGSRRALARPRRRGGALPSPAGRAERRASGRRRRHRHGAGGVLDRTARLRCWRCTSATTRAARGPAPGRRVRAALVPGVVAAPRRRVAAVGNAGARASDVRPCGAAGARARRRSSARAARWSRARSSACSGSPAPDTRSRFRSSWRAATSRRSARRFGRWRESAPRARRRSSRSRFRTAARWPRAAEEALWHFPPAQTTRRSATCWAAVSSSFRIPRRWRGSSIALAQAGMGDLGTVLEELEAASVPRLESRARARRLEGAGAAHAMTTPPRPRRRRSIRLRCSRGFASLRRLTGSYPAGHPTIAQKLTEIEERDRRLPAGRRRSCASTSSTATCTSTACRSRRDTQSHTPIVKELSDLGVDSIYISEGVRREELLAVAELLWRPGSRRAPNRSSRSSPRATSAPSAWAGWCRSIRRWRAQQWPDAPTGPLDPDYAESLLRAQQTFETCRRRQAARPGDRARPREAAHPQGGAEQRRARTDSRGQAVREPRRTATR